MLLRPLRLLGPAVLLAVLSACSGGEDTAKPAEVEDCANDADDDGDGAADCDDDDCAAEPSCTPETACGNDVDDDEDGDIDCADDDCVTADACTGPATETNCTDGEDEDGDGATDCDDSDCAASTACSDTPTETDCADGMDEDVDGAIDCADSDCAADPACAPPATETACGDGADDDGDGAIDCDDTDCEGDAACASTGTCTLAGDLGSSIGYALATGSTTGAGEHFTTSCTSTDAEDAIWSWTAPADGDYAIDLYDSGYDTVVGLLSSDCATEIDCNDDSSGLTSYLEFTATAGETFNIQVTGYSTTGDYVLSVYATSEVDCTDGTDEDGDDELDCADLDCVGDAACPAETSCDDGLDDDGDGTTDCDDYDCESDAACAPTCEAEGDLGSELGYGLATGSTADADDIFTSSCSSSAYTPPDEIWTWTAPATGTYTADLVDSTYDTVLAIGSADCTSETTCDDDTIGTISVVAFTATAGDTLSFVVSGFSSSGDYTLSIYSDTEIDCADGEDEDGDGRTDCDDLECTTEAACAPTVETTCDDGLDDDADGLVDCDDTDCAADAACLVESACADGLDDDADGLVDCDDTDCAASADCP